MFLHKHRDKIAKKNAELAERTGPITRERFRIDVTENLNGIGGALTYRGKRQSGAQMLMAYRVTVIDNVTGKPQFVAQQPSYRLAYRVGEAHVERILADKKAVKAPWEGS